MRSVQVMLILGLILFVVKKRPKSLKYKRAVLLESHPWLFTEILQADLLKELLYSRRAQRQWTKAYGNI